MTPPEESYIRRRNELSIHIFECIWTTQLCFDIRGNMSSSLISLSEDLSLTTAVNQQIVQSFTYDTPCGPASLNITLGHTGPELRVFITITTSDGFSERFLDQGDSFPVRPVLIREIKRLNHIV